MVIKQPGGFYKAVQHKKGSKQGKINKRYSKEEALVLANKKSWAVKAQMDAID